MEKVRENALCLLANMVSKFCDPKLETSKAKGVSNVIAFFQEQDLLSRFEIIRNDKMERGWVKNVKDDVNEAVAILKKQLK